MHHRRRQWRYFFPFQLLLLHLKKNHFLLTIWVLLFAVITGSLGQRIGLPQQFLVPEYLGHTGLLSFAMLGFAVGGFISGFNLYTYMMHGYRFPVIATLSRPFHKFCINNILLPAIFVSTYLYCSALFQLQRECIAPVEVLMNLLVFLLSISVFQALSFFYFLHTNKEAASFGNSEEEEGKQISDDSPVDSPIHGSFNWLSSKLIGHKWRVDTYLTSYSRISWARDGRHYKREILEKVFEQNQLNASRFELLVLISFLFLGAVASIELFVLPAGASVLLFLTMLIMAISALHSWLRGWTFTLVVAFVAFLNGAHHKLSWFRNPTTAYGLNYGIEPAHYDPYSIVYDSLEVQQDLIHSQTILGKRLLRASSDSAHKPKLVILNHSGGGTRSAYWTMRAIPYADSVCNGALLKHTVLMTGASGGMVGAAYLRELMLQADTEPLNLLDPRYAHNMGMDLLNPIVLAATTGDWFIRYRRLNDGNYTYSKDRATALEEQLHRNTHGAFDRRLKDYAIPESGGIIPMIILTPTIANDGRRLVIGSQPLSYICVDEWKSDRTGAMLNENVEFNRLFAAHDAGNLHFSSALRMNASFPYMTPMASLPSEPAMEVFDAGIRDNFGWKTTVRFVLAHRAWIEANTDGVVIVQVRDLPRDKDLNEHAPSLVSKFSAPLGGIYGNLTRTQDYAGDEELQLMCAALKVPVDAVQFQLEQTKQSQISLSWHLTQSEKNYINKAVHEPYFESELARLKKLLDAN
jgi:hypothetical protein